MITSSPSTIMHLYKNTHLSSSANDSVTRDMTQSRRLHEPTYRISNIDPITGDDIQDFTRHPCLIDGNLTIYFETVFTRNAYIVTPLNHPSIRLPFPVADDDDRGG